MVQYDRAVIQQFAERLYSLARRIVVTATILGGLLGFILGAVLASAIVGASERLGMSSSSSMLVMLRLFLVDSLGSPMELSGHSC